MVTLKMDWVVGHIKSRAAYPELTWEPTNWRIEHRGCSDRTGTAAIIEKAKREALREAGVPAGKLEQLSGFSPSEAPKEPPPLPASLSLNEDVDAEGFVRPVDALSWDPGYLAQFEWLRPLLDVPEDASVPLMMSRVPVDAVGTYGWDAIEWIEGALDITLRWWQRLSVVRQLEHRADGSLCFEKKVESAPRRAGKSVGLRGTTLWRLAHGQDLFGEVQTSIHTGSDMAICREVQMKSWIWSEAQGWNVTRGNGKEAVETPGGDRWLVRAQDAVYGYDATCPIVDEGWNVKPDTVSEGLEPAMLERSSPQLTLTSTAHRRATSLMRTELSNGVAGEDPTVLLLLWSVDPLAPGYDPGDVRLWKAASPHWSEARRRLIQGKYLKALNGQDDPEFDDPDPMKGFEAQYLNIWRLRTVRTVGNPVVEAEAWDELREVRPSGAPAAVAVESWFAQGVAVAEARISPFSRRVVVSTETYADLESAATAVAASGVREALVGASLKDAAVWRTKGVPVKGASGRLAAQVADLVRHLGEHAFKHDGSPALTEQVLNLRVSPGADGIRIRSTERADAVKAAAWAIDAAVNAPPPPKVNKIITVAF